MSGWILRRLGQCVGKKRTSDLRVVPPMRRGASISVKMRPFWNTVTVPVDSLTVTAVQGVQAVNNLAYRFASK